MNAEAKSERLGCLRAVKVEGCRFRKDGVVATGGSEPEEELGAFRQVHVAEFNGTLGRAPPHGDGWVVAQRLVYRTGNQLGVCNHGIPARWIFKQSADGVADQVIRRFVTGECERVKIEPISSCVSAFGSSSWISSKALAKSSSRTVALEATSAPR